MKSRKNDLTGQRFTRWLVLNHAGTNADGVVAWHCRCDCGTERIVLASSLTLKRSRSCGCLMRETTARQAKRLFTKHGHTTDYSVTPEYLSWAAMIQRCRNPKSIGFKNYGGRGIQVCKRWQKSFANFIADMGNKPTRKHTIDRIDNDGDYKPSNCRWATKKQQANNSRRWRR